jgi:hypothetical protein
MNVLGPGERFTSVGVKAIRSAFPADGSVDKSQIVSLTCADSNVDNTALMFSMAVLDFDDCELT